MPTYDYRCKTCGHQFEAFQAISADPLTECPLCNGRVARMIGGGTGLIFKGSGFYITDYKKSRPTTDSKSNETKSTESKS